MQVAEFLVGALAAYGLAGVLFAVVFVMVGVQRVDPVATHAPVGFRLIIMPGAVATWPLLLICWMRAPSPQTSPGALR